MVESILKPFGLADEQDGAGSGSWRRCGGPLLQAVSPINGAEIGRVRSAAKNDCEAVIDRAARAFETWRTVPAPRRGEIVRQIGEALRRHKRELGSLVSLETGKIRAEGEGEVQEMIDIADFALGQSRMLYGLSMHSERPDHRMYEQWHPLGPVGVISAFNFPVAVWSWNALIALAAGDTVIWKPSSKAMLSAIAVMKIVWPVLERNELPEGVLNLLIGGREAVGEQLINDARIPLISATGSVRMGRHVARTVAARLGRSLLELGGNNAIVVTPNADIDLAVRAIVFGAVGTAGQRCTSTRRLIVHADIYNRLAAKLVDAYRQIKIGDPLQEGILMGPLIDTAATAAFQAAIAQLEEQGGRVLCGGTVLSGGIYDVGTYVSPCICEARADMPIVQAETFAPLLYLIKYETLAQAIDFHNAVPQGLSSAIFTRDMRESEYFLSARGSDCGIANVNIGTSGAEIGGAFGGEKETGGGRESGSDAWKAYMRRQTCTINWSNELPLAQGISFDLG
ncbi:MAG: aldehyde dehydrogenase family protein [Desulfobacterales bacterium]